MAPPKTAPSAPAALAKAPPMGNNAEIVDSRTGEVVAIADTSGSEAIDAAALSLLSDGNMLERLKKAQTAKKEDFQTLDLDFWTPGQPGTPDAVLQGIFIGSGKNKGARIIQHAVAVLGKDGTPVIVRLNGRHGLTSALKQIMPRDVVRIEYKGESVSQGLMSGTGGGNRFKLWEVTKIKA